MRSQDRPAPVRTKTSSKWVFCGFAMLLSALAYLQIATKNLAGLLKMVHIDGQSIYSNNALYEASLLFLTPRPDGFNNQLITVAETIRCAQLYNRTLVLPLMYANKRYDTSALGPFPFEDYFDLQPLQDLLPVMTISQIGLARPSPCQRILYSKSAHSDSSEFSPGSLLKLYRKNFNLRLKYVPSSDDYMNETCIDDSFCASINFAIDEHFGFYSDYARFGQGYNINNSSALQTIKAALKPSRHVLEIANVISESIGGKYNAMHIRRGDYNTKCEQMKDFCEQYGADSFLQSAETLLAKMRAFSNSSLPVYISTTHAGECRELLKESEFTMKFQDQVILPDTLEWAIRRVDIMALASQVVASRAEEFVGNRYSSFSAEVNNMRFFLNKTEKRLFF